MIIAQPSTAAAGDCAGQTSIFPRWYDGLCDGTKIQSPKTVENKIDGDNTGVATFATKVAINIVTILLTVVGYVSLAFIIWGGFKYMISGDSSGGTSSAKNTILNAIIGLVLSIMAVAIVRVITGAI